MLGILNHIQFEQRSTFTPIQYINPSNIEYDPVCGYTMYPQIVDKLPNTFLLLVGISAFCTFCGYIFLFDKPEESAECTAAINSNQRDYGSISSGECKDDGNTYKSDDTDECVDPIEVQNVEKHSNVQDMDNIGIPLNYTVSQALRTVQFWIIFGNVLLGVFVLAFVYSDWKLFALEYLLIENDSFLLSLNIAAAMSGFVGRFFWGAMCDYTGSYGRTMMMVTGFECIVISTLPLCPIGNKVMAFIWICVLWFCVSASYTLFPPALSNQFGNKYCGVLTGFAMISEIVATFSQSGCFTLLDSVQMTSRERWMLLCVEQGAFVAISFMISMRFKETDRCKKYSGME